MPTLSAARSASWRTKTQSNMREMARGLALYAGEYKDHPPNFGHRGWPPVEPYIFDFGTQNGFWFHHSTMWAWAISAYLENQWVGLAGDNPGPPQSGTHNGVIMTNSDFQLTNTLYPDPEFFRRETQRGASQFRTQALSTFQYPSAKGLLLLGASYRDPLHQVKGTGHPGPDMRSFLFADHSVDFLDFAKLPLGAPNRYREMSMSPHMDPDDIPGTPVLDTLDGTRGRDRQ